MLTKKYFKQIADVIKETNNDIKDLDERGYITTADMYQAKLITNFVIMCKRDNPNFNAEKFKEYING